MNITMKKISYLLAISIASLMLSMASIAQSDTDNPVWLKNKLEIYQKSDPFINVKRTEYKGKVAYHIAPRCCDIPSELYDESGTLICYPSGGFAGGDGRCPTFGLGEEIESKAYEKVITE